MLSEDLKENWERVVGYLGQEFGGGEKPDLDAVLFLIGVQELGSAKRKFKKDEKVNLMHIAICRVLEPYGYYEYEGLDEDGWPHWIELKPIKNLAGKQQDLLIKEAIIAYFA